MKYKITYSDMSAMLDQSWTERSYRYLIVNGKSDRIKLTREKWRLIDKARRNTRASPFSRLHASMALMEMTALHQVFIPMIINPECQVVKSLMPWI